jgi:hypothetical protein
MLGEWSRYRQLHPAGPAERLVPFVLYNLSPDDRAVMVAAMPPNVLTELVPIAWADDWRPMKPFLLD